MHYRVLGRTDIRVSSLCLGTMTWGQQNSETEGHAQLDFAVGEGINFIDAAEMYPVPPKAETQGATERILGTWLKGRKDRDKLIVASKVTGRSSGFSYLRGGPRLSRAHIREALEGSLRRLQTDYVDLYQLHWPERSTNYFGQLGYSHLEEEGLVSLEESLSALGELIKEGKIRHVGLSNETPWGVMEALRLAREKSLPRIVSIQNPYNLLNRVYEVGLAEMSIREDCGLLAYSPLAFGMLSGKYEGGAKPAGARLTLFERFQRYNNPGGITATHAYVELARAHDLSPAQMALAYINSRPFVTANIVGATTMEQLKENIASLRLTLSPEILREIETIHSDHPNPCP